MDNKQISKYGIVNNLQHQKSNDKTDDKTTKTATTKTTTTNKITSKITLFEHQVKHVNSLIKSLKAYNRALDASDTGTGKTYSSIAIAKKLKQKPFIICPKSVIPSWLSVMKAFNCDFIGIANYELIKNCRYYTDETMEKKKCPYVNVTKVERLVKKKNKLIKKTEKKYIWKNLPSDTLIIFDESHKCKNTGTQNSDILFTLSHYPFPILLLSATACDKPENFKIYGYVLGLYPKLSDGKTWIDGLGGNMITVHQKVFPEYGSRMKIRDISKDVFKNSKIVAECIKMKSSPEIEKQYEFIEKAVEMLQKKQKNSVALALLIRARQKVEMLKVPVFIKLIEEGMKKGYSIAMFCNFTDSLRKISEYFDTQCLIFGEQTLEERTKAIKDFNNDDSRLIICNIRAGGVGISLHDTNGKFPRMSIISPTWSAQDLLQVLGRVNRANAKTDSIQRIIFSDDKYERMVCKNMTEKICNIGHLNDGDLQGYQIEGLIGRQKIKTAEEKKKNKFEDLYNQISACNVKKKRLQESIKDTDEKIKELQRELNSMVVTMK